MDFDDETGILKGKSADGKVSMTIFASERIVNEKELVKFLVDNQNYIDTLGAKDLAKTNFEYSYEIDGFKNVKSAGIESGKSGAYIGYAVREDGAGMYLVVVDGELEMLDKNTDRYGETFQKMKPQ